MSSPCHDEAITNPVITLAAGEQNFNQINIPDPKRMRFDVYDDSYADFIQNIRDELTHSDAHGIPVLRPQGSETAQNVLWLDILLVADDNSITVKLQQSNLYVRGYKRSKDDFFWEFNDSHLIIGSRDLGFKGGYMDSESMGKKAYVNREDLHLGASPLANAIRTLDRVQSPTDNYKLAARNLLVIVQMTAEAARFRTISEHISINYWNDNGVKIDIRMVNMENGWSDLSTALRQMTDTDPTPLTELPNIPVNNPTEVHTFGQARDALGILLIKIGTEGSMAMNADYHGRCLMNLEYVLINNIDGEDPGKLYGTVRAYDGWFTYTFYDRSSGDYERVGPGGFATLTDSSYPYAVSGADSFIISVDLSDHYWIFPDDKIAQGEIVWELFGESVTFENYDKHLQQMVKGEYGNVTVGYSVISNALGVTIQVLLVNGDGEDPADVYGTLSASQVLGGYAGSIPISLFDVSSSGYVDVRPGQAIPLTRTVIAAAMSTKLTITADLWDYDLLSPDDPIAQGSADFTVQLGTQYQFIDGEYGQIKVIITCQ